MKKKNNLKAENFFEKIKGYAKKMGEEPTYYTM